MCIKAAPEGKDVQLVEFGDLLQELLAVRPQSRVQHGLPSAQLEVENALRRETSGNCQQSNFTLQLSILESQVYQVTAGD